MNRDELIAAIKELGEDELEIVKDSLRDAANKFAPTVLAEAKDAVKEAAKMLNAPGTAKKEAAFDMIWANLLAKGIAVGIEVGIPMIYKMIETAYRWFMENIVGIRPGELNTGLPFHP